MNAKRNAVNKLTFKALPSSMSGEKSLLSFYTFRKCFQEECQEICDGQWPYISWPTFYHDRRQWNTLQEVQEFIVQVMESRLITNGRDSHPLLRRLLRRKQSIPQQSPEREEATKSPGKLGDTDKAPTINPDTGALSYHCYHSYTPLLSFL